MKKLVRLLHIGKPQIVFTIFFSCIGLLCGWFSLTDKQCGEIMCNVSLSENDLKFYYTPLCNAIISNAHLEGLTDYVGDLDLSKEKIRSSLSLNMTRDNQNFSILFVCDSKKEAVLLSKAFCEYSIIYLNDKVHEIRKSLNVSKIDFYSTSNFKYKIISSSICSFVFGGACWSGLLFYNKVSLTRRINNYETLE